MKANISYFTKIIGPLEHIAKYMQHVAAKPNFTFTKDSGTNKSQEYWKGKGKMIVDSASSTLNPLNAYEQQLVELNKSTAKENGQKTSDGEVAMALKEEEASVNDLKTEEVVEKGKGKEKAIADEKEWETESEEFVKKEDIERA
jgi:hypothetical protein